MIQPVQLYQVACDVCGFVEDRGDYVAWEDGRQAEDAAEDSGWHVERGNHLCEECIPHPPDWDRHHDRAANSVEPLVCEWCEPTHRTARHHQ